MEIVTVDITLFKSFIGKVVPFYQSELILLGRYRKPGTRDYINDFISNLENIDVTNINYNQLVTVITNLERTIAINSPVSNKVQTGVKIDRIYHKGKYLFIDIEYSYE